MLPMQLCDLVLLDVAGMINDYIDAMKRNAVNIGKLDVSEPPSRSIKAQLKLKPKAM